MSVLSPVLVLVLGFVSSCACRSQEKTVTLDELQKQLTEEPMPVLLDVRLASDFDEAPQVISSARWQDPERLDEWSRELPKDRQVIVYCAHGHLISRGTAARLRARGFDARVLDGGIEAWKESGRAVVPGKRE